MNIVRILVCLCLVTLAFALNNEKELKRSVEACCTGHCSKQHLDSLHDRLSVYSKSHNADPELVEFGMQVLGGKRCDPHNRARQVAPVAPNANPKARSSSKARAAASVTLHCPSGIYYQPGVVLNCTVDYRSDNGIYAAGAWAEAYSNYLQCANSCEVMGNQSTTITNFLVGFVLNPNMPSFVNVYAYLYDNYYTNYTYATTTVSIYGLPSTTTTSYSTTGYPSSTTGGGGGNTGSVTVKCPPVVAFSNSFSSVFTCNVSIIAPYYDAFYYSNYDSSLYCSNCYQYNYGIYSLNYTASFSANGYGNGSYPITIWFYTINYYYYSSTVNVTLVYKAPQINLDKFIGPTTLPPTFTTFDVTVNINSEYMVREIDVYYVDNYYNYGAMASYYNYNGSTSKNFTFTANKYYYSNYTTGTYCALVYIYDVQGNYRQFNGTCFTIATSGCQPGYYKSANSTAGCKPCPQGFYAEQAGAFSCTPCPSGYTSSCASASRSCVSCPAGTSSKGGVCVPCAAGTYSSYAAQSTCNPCGAGTYSNGTGNTYCTYCNSGTYSCAGSSNCTVCKAGTYSPYTGSNVCYSCADGYSSYAGSYYCFQCPANTYAVSGAGTCTACPAGQTSPPGSFACYDAKKR